MFPCAAKPQEEVWLIYPYFPLLFNCFCFLCGNVGRQKPQFLRVNHTVAICDEIKKVVKKQANLDLGGEGDKDYTLCMIWCVAIGMG